MPTNVEPIFFTRRPNGVNLTWDMGSIEAPRIRGGSSIGYGYVSPFFLQTIEVRVCGARFRTAEWNGRAYLVPGGC